MKIPKHEATTAQLGAAYPFVCGQRLPGDKILIGRESSGLTFAFDPFELYQHGVVTNPNMIVLGQVGRGKSTFVKSFLFRQHAFGRRIVVIDPKGEYGPFGSAVDAEVLRIAADGSRGLNPLDLASSAGAKERSAALQHSVLEGVCATSLGRRLDVMESVALQMALQRLRNEVRRVTLRDVADRLLHPRADDAVSFGSSRSALLEAGRIPGFAILRLLGGEFGAMFDGNDATSVDLRAEALVVDVSDFYRSDALAVVLISLFGALQRVILESTAPTVLVVDEAWAVVGSPVAASFLQSFFKLSRSLGLANILVAHRPSDIAEDQPTWGAERSVRPDRDGATGLLADCETSVLFALSPKESHLAQHLFGLNDRQRQLLVGLERGRALWSVGDRRSLVQHTVGAEEMAFIDTDRRMRL